MMDLGAYYAQRDAVLAGEIEDTTPFGMDGDWCPFCAADWKRPCREYCESPFAKDWVWDGEMGVNRLVRRAEVQAFPGRYEQAHEEGAEK
jgi:hypothetical protein